MQNPYIHLTSKNSSLILKAADGVPEILYWGQPLPAETDISAMAAALSFPIPQATIDSATTLSLCPELGEGLFTSPGLDGSRNGDCWAPVFTVEETLQEDQSVSFQCRDNCAGLKLDISLKLDEETNVCETQLKLTNEADTPYQLQRLTNTLPLPAYARELMYFHGRWTHEMQTKRLQLEQGAFTQENRRGRTSHERFPGLVAGTQGFNENSGKVFGFHLGWSGNHRLHTEVMDDGRRYIQAGELLMPGEVTLQPGESYSTPTLFSCFSNEGLNGMSQSFHRHVRQHIVKFPEPEKVRPVHLNTWEGIYFDHDPAYIMKMAEEAAKIGAERFIIDDGWFLGRNHDRAGLGDWYLDEEKYPEGLTPVINCVKENGMEFGLWFEPEMVNPDSNLFRAHPDWMLHTEGYPQVTVRNQYMLNLQKPEVFDYLLERLDEMLTRYDIRYIKWDMNREVVQGTHNSKAAFHGHVDAYYRLVEAVRAKHPQVEIETCSGGGGRIDYGILSRTHRFWASDCNDPLERQSIQKGGSYFFPLEVTGAHIGAGLCHTTGRQHTLGFRGMTALFGHMGVELDPAGASEEEKQAFAEYITLHKSLRSTLHTGDYFRCDTAHQDTQAWGVVSKDKSDAVFMFTQLALTEYALSAPLEVPGLDEHKLYTVSVLQNSSSDMYMKQLPAWMTEECTVSGATLKQAGLMMPVLQPESALLIKFEAVN